VAGVGHAGAGSGMLVVPTPSVVMVLSINVYVSRIDHWLKPATSYVGGAVTRSNRVNRGISVTTTMTAACTADPSTVHTTGPPEAAGKYQQRSHLDDPC
jgi:hypothetical protein